MSKLKSNNNLSIDFYYVSAHPINELSQPSDLSEPEMLFLKYFVTKPRILTIDVHWISWQKLETTYSWNKHGS